MKKALLTMVALLCVSLAGVAQTANDKIYFRNDVEVCPKNPQLERYLKTSLKYPEEAIQQNMQAYTDVMFVVNPDGTVSELMTLSRPSLLTESTMKVLEKMPKWQPGKVGGKAVKTRMSLFVKYSFDGTIADLKTEREVKAAKGKTFVKVAINFKDKKTEAESNIADIVYVVYPRLEYSKGGRTGTLTNNYADDDDERMMDVDKRSNRDDYVVGAMDIEEGRRLMEDKVIVEEKHEAPEQQIFTVVEQSPVFPYGDERMWIAKNMKYPPVAEENGIQGRVVCQFVIEPDGSISTVTVAKGVDPSLDREAVRVIKAMPKWTPGKQNGKAVRVRYTMPITFMLSDPEPSEKQQ